MEIRIEMRRPQNAAAGSIISPTLRRMMANSRLRVNLKPVPHALFHRQTSPSVSTFRSKPKKPSPQRGCSFRFQCPELNSHALPRFRTHHVAIHRYRRAVVCELDANPCASSQRLRRQYVTPADAQVCGFPRIRTAGWQFHDGGFRGHRCPGRARSSLIHVSVQLADPFARPTEMRE
jgi:hypothetical protein